MHQQAGLTMAKAVVLIAEYLQLNRYAICCLLETRSQVITVATGTGDEMVLGARRMQPAVILLDTLLPDMTAKEVTERILHNNPTAKILLFAESYNERAVTEALAAGAVAAVEKSVAATLFVAIVAHLLENNDGCSGRMGKWNQYIDSIRPGACQVVFRLPPGRQRVRLTS